MKNATKDKIYSFKTKSEHGFTRNEIIELLEKEFKGIKIEDIFEKLGCITVMVIDGETIIYHHDVLLGINCVLQKRKPTIFELD